jgi:hypothetical protein
VETSERALRERIVWRGERFPVGVSGPLGLHLIVEEGRCVEYQLSLSRLSSACFFLFVHSGRGRQPTYMKRRREGEFLDIKLRCQGGRRRPQVEATDVLVIQLTLCCQSVLAVMLAKAGVSPVLPTIGFEPMTLAV